MAHPRTIVAIDQGTTGTTALVLDLQGRVRGSATTPVPQHFPAPGQVEHDGEDLWRGVQASVARALAASGDAPDSVAALGLTNQRETSLLWDRATGLALHRALVWQDRRTADRCERLREKGLEPLFQQRAGLLLDPYFSGTKLGWLLDNVPGARARASRGELAFGTVDSWVLHRLTGGAHLTDPSNASRTLLFNLHTLAWDDELLAALDVPRALLPQVVPSSGVVAHTRGLSFLPDGVPIAGIAGDQQAALFGQGCLRAGDVKCTYGTGAFVLMNVGKKPVLSTHRLLATVAWQTEREVAYALEGSAFIAGAAVQWLRDGLGVLKSAGDIEALARSVPDSGEVVFVPALTGLGAPYWAPHARGLLTGLGRDTTVAHLCRATLEGIALEITDLMDAMARDAGAPVASLRVDGGASANDLLMQLQADLLGAAVVRPRVTESTAYGAGLLALLGAGLVGDPAELAGIVPVERTFIPAADRAAAEALRARWRVAVARCLTTTGGES
ncbi:MAG: glycerol kinase GlpK [Deltaproteobacteria bacterium]|nr:glycerol kinase GlpK [Deltaproteobacteria bacterium]